MRQASQALAFAAAALTAAVALGLAAGGRHDEMPEALALGAAALGWLAWDFVRAEGYATGRAQRVFAADATYLVIIVAVVVSLYAAAWLSAAAVLAGMGTAGIAAALVATRGRFPGAPWRNLRRQAAVLWQRGRWSFAAAQASWLQSQAYIYITTLMLSLEALAALAAARMLMAPLATVLAAWSKAMLPRLAEMPSASRLAACARASLAFVLLAALWAALLLGARDLVAERLFLGKYPQIAALLALWGVAMAANGFRTVCMTALRAGGGFAALTRISAFGAVATLALCPLGVLTLGGEGAVLALACVELTVGLLFLLMLRRAAAGGQGGR